MRKKNNKGFSLIELVVTLAVMAIITVVSISIYSWIHSAKIKSASKTIDSTISELRSLTLSRSDEWKMTVNKETNNYRIVIYRGEIAGGGINWSEYDTYHVSKAVDIYCKDAANQKIKIGESYGGGSKANIEIRYKKSDGSFDILQCNKSGSENFKIKDIYFEYGNYERIIHLVELTGKHSVNK